MNMDITKVKNKDDIFFILADVLHEMFEIDRDKIDREAHLFNDLDIDSIDAVDLVVRLSEMTGKRMQPEIFRSVRKVQDVVDALSDLLLEEMI